MQHCKVCHQTFSGASLADDHRERVGTYVLAKPTLKSKNSELQRFQVLGFVPDKWVVVSEGNSLYRCLDVTEMSQRKWRLMDGVWRGPEVPEELRWWKKEDSENEAESELV